MGAAPRINLFRRKSPDTLEFVTLEGPLRRDSHRIRLIVVLQKVYAELTMKKSLIALFVLAVVAGGGAYMQQTGRLDGAVDGRPRQDFPANRRAETEKPRRKQDNKNSSPVEVAAASVKTLSDDITAVGTLLSDESVQIAAETDGRIAAIKFKRRRYGRCRPHV